jgi:hypothetical protein
MRPAPPETRRLSQAELLDLERAVQQVVEVTPGLEGVLVLDVYEAAAPPDGAPLVHITGKLRSEDQRARLEETLRDVLLSRAYWRDLQPPVTVGLSAMQVVGPSNLLASRYYGLALKYFWNGDCVRSERAISLAIAEAPQVVIYRYWGVLMAIARGDLETARMKLRPLLAADPYGSSSRDVAVLLERVQGPLRSALESLEEELLLEGQIGPPPATGPPPVPASAL